MFEVELDFIVGAVLLHKEKKYLDSYKNECCYEGRNLYSSNYILVNAS